MKETLRFSDPRDALNFQIGMPVRNLTSDESAAQLLDLRPSISDRARDALLRHLPWFFPRVIVSRVDVDAGVIELQRQRWSWRRWQWTTMV